MAYSSLSDSGNDTSRRPLSTQENGSGPDRQNMGESGDCLHTPADGSGGIMQPGFNRLTLGKHDPDETALWKPIAVMDQARPQHLICRPKRKE
jgi:hypothetical protein